MTQPIILLDVDDVLADFEPPYLKIINEVTGINLRTEDRTEWEILSKVPKDFHEAIVERARAEGFCRNLQVTPGSQEAVDELRTIGQVYAVTSPWGGHKTWCWERTEWLKEHFGFKPSEVLHVSAKHLIRGEVLIDDRIDNLVGWAQCNTIACLAILWDKPYNRDCSKFLRAKNWDMTIKLLRAVYGDGHDPS